MEDVAIASGRPRTSYTLTAPGQQPFFPYPEPNYENRRLRWRATSPMPELLRRWSDRSFAGLAVSLVSLTSVRLAAHQAH